MRNKRSKSGGIYKTVLIILLIFCVVLVSAVAVYGLLIGNKVTNREAPPKVVSTDKPVNILLLGVDAGDYDSSAKNSPKRSDTIIIIRYNPENNKIFLLSIPRDTRITVNGRTEKINAVHAIGGVPLTIKTIERMLGIEINYYAEVDYAGFKKCVDAVGGIDVVVPQDMDYDAYDIHIHFKKGEKVHLDGENAERFVRWRKNNDGGGYAMGDLGRVSTQQDFIIKVIGKLKTPSGIIRLPSLINTLSRYVKTNMDTKIMLAYSLKLMNVKSTDIEKKVLEGEPRYIGNISYFIWNSEKNREYLQNFKDSNRTIRAVSGDRGKIKVIVLNSTGQKGLAAEYKNKLEYLGYNVTEIGNYNKNLDSSSIDDYSNEGYGSMLYEDLGFGRVNEKDDENNKSDIILILGRDAIKK